MIIQGVHADTGGREGKWVGLIIVFILCFATVAIPFHQAESKIEVLLDHQVLVTDIKQENLAMLSELRLAHEEIRDLRIDSEGEWPSVTSLKNQWVAPFVEDPSWKRKGSHVWRLDERGYYFAIPNEPSISNEHAAPSEFATSSEYAPVNKHSFAGSFILNANSVSPEIWVFLDGFANPPAHFDENTLASAGWKLVVNESEVVDQHAASYH
ncbi:hypothetical protein [uncultured Vibrio sp.]|uniref:DUF6162 family protein n=1 Tax=uncultured Vibrio sp. TaxID=114054 RepID=UPI0026141CB0|nr:hypothetical protein [uncultured Vibrio sp.]